jgi:hypothetical protein
MKSAFFMKNGFKQSKAMYQYGATREQDESHSTDQEHQRGEHHFPGGKGAGRQEPERFNEAKRTTFQHWSSQHASAWWNESSRERGSA